MMHPKDKALRERIRGLEYLVCRADNPQRDYTINELIYIIKALAEEEATETGKQQ